MSSLEKFALIDLAIGDIVRVRRVRLRDGRDHGGETGIVIALAEPFELRRPSLRDRAPGLLAVAIGDDVVRGIAPDLLELVERAPSPEIGLARASSALARVNEIARRRDWTTKRERL